MEEVQMIKLPKWGGSTGAMVVFPSWEEDLCMLMDNHSLQKEKYTPTPHRLPGEYSTSISSDKQRRKSNCLVTQIFSDQLHVKIGGKK